MRDLLARRFVMNYLYRRQQEALKHYPQMVCYAFDAITMHLAVDGRYEAEELEFILNRFRNRIEGRTVLDVGANIGNHSLAFAGLAAHVVALEPHPVTFRLLELNARHHGNITALNLGASDRAATVQAMTPLDNAGGCAIGGETDGERVQFKVQRVDDLPGLRDVGLIKIDIEGHEDHAIAGMERLLRDQKPLMVLEQNQDVIDAGTSPAILRLRNLGYNHLYSVEKRHPWRFPFGRLGHLAEGVLRGVPPLEARLEPIVSLEQRDYPCLVASTEAL